MTYIHPLKIGTFTAPNNLILAPMAGITDSPFRVLCLKGGAGLVCAEMVSAHALHYGNEKSGRMLQVNPKEHPVSMQIFGSDEATIAEAAKNAAAQSADAAGESANQSAESAATAERNAEQAATDAKTAKDAADKIDAEKIDDKLTQMGSIQTAVEKSATDAAKSAEDAQKALEQIDVRPLTKADIAELLAMI